jgi:N utilization substance protein B
VTEIRKQGAVVKGRRKARETALQALYQMELSGAPGELPAKNADAAGEPCDDDYSRALIGGVTQRKAELDGLIAGSSEHWDLDRMSVVDRCVLRMAVYEMLFGGDVPYKVAIDEAVSLAAKYGGDESGGFVNGVLDSIAKTKLRKGTLEN